MGTMNWNFIARVALVPCIGVPLGFELAPKIFATSQPRLGHIALLFALFVLIIPALMIGSRATANRFLAGVVVTFTAAVFYLVPYIFQSFMAAVFYLVPQGIIASPRLFVSEEIQIISFAFCLLAIVLSPVTGAISALIGMFFDNRRR